MRKFIVATCAVTLLTGVALSAMQDEAPAQQQWEPPQPTKHHEWLQQLVGEWTFEANSPAGPGWEANKSSGTESVRALGGFWAIGEVHGEMGGSAFTAMLTIGFDTRKEHYVATWVDSMTDIMWTYEGKLNEAGDTLTLATEGPNPMDATKTAVFNETLKIVDKDHRTFTSKLKQDDGSWTTMVTINYTRKH